jgi:hypothetical protein
VPAFQLLGLAAILLVLLCGCSSFNRAWHQAGQTPAVTESIEGRWEGTWSSDANGHTGKLRCVLSREPDGKYTAWFRATYLRILRFSYRVPLQVEPHGGVWPFHGSEDLGSMAGGVYHYTGSATPTNFYSTYRSAYDHGIFVMSRP